MDRLKRLLDARQLAVMWMQSLAPQPTRKPMLPILASCGKNNHAWSVTEEIRDPKTGNWVPLRLTCTACQAWRKIDIGEPDPETAQFLKDTYAWLDW